MGNMIITPYHGCGSILLTADFSEVKNAMRDSGIGYTVEHWPNKGCTPEVAWDIIRANNGINLFFAEGKMFKMYFERGFEGALYNGIHIGMTIPEAINLDPKLEYCDDEEYYSSPAGYWLEESLKSGQIETITIFIPELLDDDLFFAYEWCR